MVAPYELQLAAATLSPSAKLLASKRDARHVFHSLNPRAEGAQVVGHASTSPRRSAEPVGVPLRMADGLKALDGDHPARFGRGGSLSKDSRPPAAFAERLLPTGSCQCGALRWTTCPCCTTMMMRHGCRMPRVGRRHVTLRGDASRCRRTQASALVVRPLWKCDAVYLTCI